MKISTAKFIEISVLKDKLKQLENDQNSLKARIVALEPMECKNEEDFTQSKLKSERSLIAVSNLNLLSVIRSR